MPDRGYKSVRDRLDKLIGENSESGPSECLIKARRAKDVVYKMYHDIDAALLSGRSAKKQIAETLNGKKARKDMDDALAETRKARDSLSKAHTKFTNAIKMIERLDKGK